MDFEWDEEKRRSNIEDHKVDFRVAVRIFRNPVIEATDERDDYGEVAYELWGIVTRSITLSCTLGAGIIAGSLAHGK